MQDPDAVITYLDSWASHLAGLSSPGITITGGTVTVDGGAVVSNVTPVSTGVIFRLAASAVAYPLAVITTTRVTLSNGDNDVRRHKIMVKKT